MIIHVAAITREHGVHAKSGMSYEILLFATLTSVLTGKSNARLVGPHLGSNSPLYGANLQSNTRGMPGGCLVLELTGKPAKISHKLSSDAFFLLERHSSLPTLPKQRGAFPQATCSKIMDLSFGTNLHSWRVLKQHKLNPSPTRYTTVSSVSTILPEF